MRLHGNSCEAAADLNAQPNIRDKTRLIVGSALLVASGNWRKPETEDSLLFSFDPVALAGQVDDARLGIKRMVTVSAERGDGLDKLALAISKRLVPNPPRPGEAVPFRRDQLEALIRRGGRRAVRISQRVQVLDQRFMTATTPSPFARRSEGWWRHRNLD